MDVLLYERVRGIEGAEAPHSSCRYQYLLLKIIYLNHFIKIVVGQQRFEPDTALKNKTPFAFASGALFLSSTKKEVRTYFQENSTNVYI